MTLNDPLAACLSKIDNAEKVSKKQVIMEGVSKMIKAVLAILQQNGYVNDVKYEENSKGGKATITLANNINRCGAIKPRFKVKLSEVEKFEQRFLPAKNFGMLVISTPHGLMTNKDAKEKKTGGRLIAYCY